MITGEAWFRRSGLRRRIASSKCHRISAPLRAAASVIRMRPARGPDVLTLLFFRTAARVSRPAALAGVLLSLMPAPGSQAADLFASLPGNWSGTGSVTKADGTSENLRCRAKYSLTPSGTVVHQELRCAADSYRLALVTDLVNQGGGLAGTWTETDRQAGGSVSGKIDGDVITTRITGTAFAADVVITTHGNRQTIALTSENGSYAKAVTIALKAD
jgi:hypothetical protein